MFKVSVVTDEISSDIETALELASSWGLRNVELRGIANQRIGNLDTFNYDNLVKNIRRFDVKVAALSPGIFKIPFPLGVYEGNTVLRWQDENEFYQQQHIKELADMHLKKLLPESIENAQRLDAGIIVVFSFNRPEAAPEHAIPQFVVDYLGEASRMAERAGIKLVLENEHICWGDNSENALEIIRQVNSPSLSLNWDSGNSYYSHEKPYPDGYQRVRGYIGHVHVKDAITDKSTGKMSYVVNGEIDWENQLRSLIDDDYNGYVTVETHCRPKILSAKQTLDRILNVSGMDALNLV
jgi:sugar phosphate isomerase/epimerase